MNFESIITFTLASGLISIAPGPDNIFVLTQSALYGKRVGVSIILGLCTGLIAHTSAVAFGVAAIFQTSPLAFDVLKYLGAAYLLYLAWLALSSESSTLSSEADGGLSFGTLYRRGIIMNVSNPKVSIFFLAFLPQFTNPAEGHLIVQFFFLGAIFITVSFIIFGCIAVMASSVGRWFASSPKGQRYLNCIAAMVFVVLAMKLLLSTVNR